MLINDLGWIDNINAYQPKIFDEAFSQCNKFAATAAASAYSSALRSEGVQATQLPSSFCSSVGNVARATVTDTYGLSDYVSATYSSGSVTPARTVSSARATSTAAQGPGATSRPATTPARTTPGSTPARSPTGPSARYTGAAANIVRVPYGSILLLMKANCHRVPTLVWFLVLSVPSLLCKFRSRLFDRVKKVMHVCTRRENLQNWLNRIGW